MFGFIKLRAWGKGGAVPDPSMSLGDGARSGMATPPLLLSRNEEIIYLFKGFYLKAKARIWCWLSYSCRVGSTAVQGYLAH